ncbi:MAG: GntR family transcriptional regulator [Planctomycetota bacterium]
MKIDPKSHVPIYLQIAAGIRAAVAAGVYLPGETLPSLRALAIDAQVNPNTVQKAYDKLEREGLVFSRRGKGLFVSEEGAASARDGARETVRRAFDAGIRAGEAAGMGPEGIREIFEGTIRHTGDAGRHQP